MKIWYAAFIPDLSQGGIACVMRELAYVWKKRGLQISLLTRKDIPSSNYLIFALKLGIHFLSSGKERPDWIIARSTDSFFCLFLIKLLRLKTAVILHNHGWERKVYHLEKRLPNRQLSQQTSWRGRFIRFPLLDITLKHCTYCISGTQFETKALKERYSQIKNKIIYISNGITLPTQPLGNTSPEPYHFLSVGNATWKKNLCHTIKLFQLIRESFPQSRLTCVGTGLDHYSFEHLCHGQVSGIAHLSKLHYRQMKDLYSSATFMLVSSIYEGGHSLAMLEAMTYGIVVFASSIPANREIIKDGVNGYLITGTRVKSDSEYLLRLLSTPESFTKICQRAEQTAQQYSWDRQAQKWIDVMSLLGY